MTTTFELKPQQKLRMEAAAVAVHFAWMGLRKALNPGQKAMAAGVFGADLDYMGASKKLVDTTLPQYRELTRIRKQAKALVESMTLPYVETGVRLCRKDRLDELFARIEEFRIDLADAVVRLEAVYPEWRERSRAKLGDSGGLYDPSDYPDTLIGQFDLRIEAVNTEPPEWMKNLSPEIYEQQCKLIEEKFKAAATLAETALAEEFGKLLSHLTDRLSGQDEVEETDDEGNVTLVKKPKTFKAASVENLIDFFDKFKALNLTGSAQLEELVEQAKGIVSGRSPKDLRDDTGMRNEIAAKLSAVGAALEGLLVDKPSRKISKLGLPKVEQQGEEARP